MRWLPSELGSRHVLINQSAFRATYFEQDKPPLTMRIVVGKKSNQTNFFTDEIERVEYNPYWGVPLSIIVNEMMPKLSRDPSYLDRLGYEVTTASGRRVSSYDVDWYAVATKKGVDQRATAAGPGKCPWCSEDPVSQQACHLHARHAAEALVSAGPPRVQPWLCQVASAARNGSSRARQVNRARQPAHSGRRE